MILERQSTTVPKTSKVRALISGFIFTHFEPFKENHLDLRARTFSKKKYYLSHRSLKKKSDFMSRKPDSASISNVGLSRHETRFFAEKEVNDIRHFRYRSGSWDGRSLNHRFPFFRSEGADHVGFDQTRGKTVDTDAGSECFRTTSNKTDHPRF